MNAMSHIVGQWSSEGYLRVWSLRMLGHSTVPLIAKLLSASHSISSTCIATLSFLSAEVTSREQLLIYVCVHTVCENMQD